MIHDKPLPSNKGVEVSLIANIFMKNDLMADCIGSLQAKDFYYNSNQIIYAKLEELYKKSIPIDLTIFLNNLNKDKIESIGGITYLSEIIGSEASINNYKEYIKIIKNLSTKRTVIRECTVALGEAYDEDIDIQEVIGTLETKMLNTSTTDVENRTVNLQELMSESIDLIEFGYKNGGQLLGTHTGYKALDNAINGFVKGDLVIIAARPSMGRHNCPVC